MRPRKRDPAFVHMAAVAALGGVRLALVERTGTAAGRGEADGSQRRAA